MLRNSNIRYIEDPDFVVPRFAQSGIAPYSPSLPAPQVASMPAISTVQQADPFAAIRNLSFTPRYRVQANLGQGNRVDQSFGSREEAEAFKQSLGSGAQTTAKIQEEFSADDAALAAGGFNSKYNRVANRGDGTLSVTMQQPGAHKYDTMEAVYKKDPATGQWVLQGTPTNSRQQSSASQIGQAIGTGAAFIGGGALLAPISAGGFGLGSTLGGGIAGNAAAGALVGSGGALISGGNTQDAIRGGVLGGISGGIQGYLGGTPSAGVSEGFDDLANLTDEQLAAMNAADLGGAVAAPSAGQTVNVVGALPSVPALPGITSGIGALSGAVTGPVKPPAPDQTVEITGNKPAPSPLPGLASGIGALPTSPTQTVEITGNKQPGMSEDEVPQPLLPSPSTNTIPTVGNNQTIEVTGNKPPKTVDNNLPVLPIGSGLAPGPMPESQIPEPLNPTAPGAGPMPASPAKPNPFLEFMNKNPKLALSLIGSLLGGGAGGGSGGAGSGPGTAIDQTQLTANPAAKFQRQYIAPPPGYRPGFDPEHRYFTGIGAVGTGG